MRTTLGIAFAITPRMAAHWWSRARRHLYVEGHVVTAKDVPPGSRRTNALSTAITARSHLFSDRTKTNAHTTTLSSHASRGPLPKARSRTTNWHANENCEQQAHDAGGGSMSARTSMPKSERQTFERSWALEALANASPTAC